MGLIACDVTSSCVVMSADSQDIVLTEGRVDPVGTGGHRKKDKIIRLRSDAFSALIGYVGTEAIDSVPTRAWIHRFIAQRSASSRFADFCTELGAALSKAWEADGLDTCLWVFIAGYEKGEGPYFWYVVNATGHDGVGHYSGISHEFRVVNDLDVNYIPRYNQGGALTKEQVLSRTTFQFYNGAIFPGSVVFQAFTRIVEQVLQLAVPGFAHPMTVERFVLVIRQRMEFLKRLYSPTHGFYASNAVPLVGGVVHVYALDPGGQFYGASKQQVVPISPS
jgi:hypothetical protein